MKRTVWIAAAGVAVAAVLGLAATLLRDSSLADVPVPVAVGPGDPAAGTRAATADMTRRRQKLFAARRTCRQDDLDQFIDEQRREVDGRPDSSDAHRLLAEALLERVLLRNMMQGLVVGEPLYSELPQGIVDDIEEGLDAIEKARAAGDETGDIYRIEASLLSNRITGWLSALNLDARVRQALERARELDGDNPRLHVALGCRLLLAPKMLGHDPDKALEHFVYAAESLPGDERPRVFAAMATWLRDRRDRARDWLQRAVTANPRNTFARVVARRLERGDDDPFGPNVTQAEIAELGK